MNGQCLFDFFFLQILNIPVFHTTLIASAVEIVIYAYGASYKFPWILECFNIDAFYFYKLIEVIVLNHENILNRDLIKHLNAVSIFEAASPDPFTGHSH